MRFVNGILLMGSVCCTILGVMGTAAGIFSFFIDMPGSEVRTIGGKTAWTAGYALMATAGFTYLILGRKGVERLLGYRQERMKRRRMRPADGAGGAASPPRARDGGERSSR